MRHSVNAAIAMAAAGLCFFTGYRAGRVSLPQVALEKKPLMVEAPRFWNRSAIDELQTEIHRALSEERIWEDMKERPRLREYLEVLRHIPLDYALTVVLSKHIDFSLETGLKRLNSSEHRPVFDIMSRGGLDVLPVLFAELRQIDCRHAKGAEWRRGGNLRLLLLQLCGPDRYGDDIALRCLRLEIERTQGQEKENLQSWLDAYLDRWKDP